MRIVLLVLACLAASALAWGAHTKEDISNERNLDTLTMLLLSVDSSGNRAPSRRATLASGVVSAFSVLPAHAAASGNLVCKPGLNNCWSSQNTGKFSVGPWTWPSSLSRDAAIAELAAVVNEYPQAGQGDVDGGGWSLVDDQLKSSGYARYEFKSSGKNWQAKMLNGGKPYTDDLEFSFGDSKLDVRSASRVGDSDFGVNVKRLNYLSDKLRKKGWDASDAKS